VIRIRFERDRHASGSLCQDAAMSPPREDRTRDALKIGAVAVAAVLLGVAGWLAENPRAFQSLRDRASEHPTPSASPSPSAALPPTAPLPPKKEVALQLLDGKSFFIHLDPRRPGVTVPAHLRNNAPLVLQVGRDMAVPIPDLVIGDAGISATLSFNHAPSPCTIPWSAVYALVGEDGKGVVWPDDVPPDVAASLAREHREDAGRAEE
jgi:hypothetical protein